MLDTLDDSLSFEGTVILTFFGFTFVIDDSHLFLLLEFFVASDSAVAKWSTIAGPLFKGHELTQDKPDFDKDKKVSSTVEGRTLHPLLDTPHKFDNKRDYKGYTHDETPVSIKLHPNVLKKYLL